MTKEQKIRACNVLLGLNNTEAEKEGLLTGERYYLPRVYMVGTDVCVTFYSALRSQRNQYILNDVKYEIDEYDIRDAYLYHYGKSLPLSMNFKVDWNFNSLGNKDAGEILCRWQHRKYRDDARVRCFC